MFSIDTKQTSNAFIAIATDAERQVEYVSHPHLSREAAQEEARRWIAWFDGFPTGEVESVYYILAVPETWPGPPPESHAYSGLFVKIGRARDISRRLQNLRTGTAGELIVHALEPGGAQLEAHRHQEFSSDRRHGEWFACSPTLMKHMFDTWSHFRVLPREHQHKVLGLAERIKILKATREVFQKAPDMINPSLNEPWRGSILIDTSIMRDNAPDPHSRRGRR